MWVVGTLVLLVAGALIVAFIGWTPRVATGSPMWDIPGLSGVYIGIVGILAGFSVGSATFIAGLTSAHGTPAFETAIGMLLVSFLILMGSAVMYGDTPSFPTTDDAFDVVFQSLAHVFANASYFLGLALGWLALRPLLLMIDLISLASIFTWLLLATVVAGSARYACFNYRLTRASGVACAAIPILGIGLPALYWLLADRVWSTLWPATDTAISFALVAFGVASIGFIHQTGLLLVHGDARLEQQVRRNGHRFGLVYLQMVTMAIGLVWIAVATS